MNKAKDGINQTKSGPKATTACITTDPTHLHSPCVEAARDNLIRAWIMNFGTRQRPLDDLDNVISGDEAEQHRDHERGGALGPAMPASPAAARCRDAGRFAPQLPAP